ncbi:MAG: RDD family protein [Candidatus Nanopelagicales bacterium]|nr:RDD family protein [Candidatus Nanopelagicales bacterium]
MNPGWYDDPLEFGWLRYWDGNTWTRETAPRPADYQPPSRQQADPGFASLWSRLGAYIIDWLIVLIPIELVVVGIWMALNVELVNGLAERLAAGDTTAFGELMAAEMGPIVLVSLLTGPAWFCYEYFMLRSRSATVGMLALGIRVVPEASAGAGAGAGAGADAGTPAVPNLPDAKLPRRALLIRAAVFGGVHLFSAVPVAGSVVNIVFLIGCLSMLFDPRSRTWHDRLARTLVISKPRNSR